MDNFKYNKNMQIEYEGKSSSTDKNKIIYEIPIDPIKARRQFRLEIKGIEIYFPHTPYDNQISYMTKACENKSLAALESPTGTGKTLCLLCASLGWLRAKRSEMIQRAKSMTGEELNDYYKTVPYIFYSSRTHSQLSNVIKELKKTCYTPKTSVLSSRDNMCVNTAVKNYSGNFLNIKCKQVRIRKECKYFFGSERLSMNSYDNFDIEELYSLGQKSGFCPFYFQRNKKEVADIIFLPYNYIFENKLRKILKLNLSNSVILIDEAHNIESVSENSKSCEFSIKMIDECLNDFKSLKIVLENSKTILSEESILKSINPTKIKEQETILTSIKGYLKSFLLKQGTGWPNFGYKLTPKEFFDIFFEGSKRADRTQALLVQNSNDSNKITGITPENIEQHITFLKKVEAGIADELTKTSIILNYVEVLELVHLLSQNYLNCVKTGDTNPNNCFINNYKIFLNDVDDINPGSIYNNAAKSNSYKIRTLFMYCFNPGFGFQDIIDANPNSVIITSGTLSPIEGVETELKCNFNIKLENKHVVDTSQVNFSILTNSVRRKIPFKFDVSNRNNAEMIEELGHTISDLCKITPGGILTFFTSYHFMNFCIGQWADRQILSEIEKSKEIFKDMQDSNKNKIVLKNFTEMCTSRKNKRGGILFSVCRGTSSEGIDFSDDMARMVIIIGIPYPNLGDVKVNLKKEFLDDFNNKNFQFLDKRLNIKKLTSGEWYTQSATRAVNQALGRVIRHIDDYGSMILIDCRYKELLYKKMFSAWLRESAKIYEDSKLIVESKNFFETMKTFIDEKQKKRKENPLPLNNITTNANKDTQKQLNVNNLNTNRFNTSNNSQNISNNCINTKNISNCANNLQPCSNNIAPCTKNDFTNILNLKRSTTSNNRIIEENNNNYIDRSVPKSTTNMTKDYYKDLYNSDEDEDTEAILSKNKDKLVKKAKKETSDNPKIAEKSSPSSIIESIENELNQIANLKNSMNNFNSTNQYSTFNSSNFSQNINNQLPIRNNISNIHPNTNTNYSINYNTITNSQPKFLKKTAYIFDSISTSSINNIENIPTNNTVNISSNNLNIMNRSKNKIEKEDENVFDNINSDELLDIINQNITIFENDILEMDGAIINQNNENENNINLQNLDHLMSNIKPERRGDQEFLNKSSGSKIKVVRRLPDMIDASQGDGLTMNALTTPAKNTCSPKQEIKSEVIVKKILELKERDMLNVLLEKYNLKICFDTQDETKGQDKESNVNTDNNLKKVECPICFESEDKKFSAAKCGHILCKECWDKCFDNKLECPICKKKVRPSTLVNIFI